VRSAPRDRPRLRLWVKLAALAAIGVVAMHALHLTLGNRIASRALATEQLVLGRSIARLVAEEAADPLLVSDLVSLNEVVSRVTSQKERGVVYCFVVKEGRVVASSFEGATPAGVVSARAVNEVDPLVLHMETRSVLDLVAPILGGDVGEVRLGLDMAIVKATRHQLARDLGLLAAGVIALGLLAAFVVGRSVARPVAEILSAADRFDPAAGADVPAVTPRGSDEISVLGERFNRMMLRLKSAYAEQARARQQSIETERLVALGSLVAGVAHEVNNPLAGLKNCVRRLERPELAEPKRREYLALMGEGLDRIEDVVKRLLDFGRPDPMSLDATDAAGLAREALQLVQPLFHEQRIASALLAEPEDAGSVLADRRRVGQALLNLLLNAAYVTPRGGEIRLRLRRRPRFRGIAVEDDGPGIPVSVRDRILDPFFTTKPEGEGTGLGLSVTRSIVDAHGGELTFDYPEHGGTVVTIWLREASVGPAARCAV
jgi:two-component system, NtrC family, sensor kinase